MIIPVLGMFTQCRVIYLLITPEADKVAIGTVQGYVIYGCTLSFCLKSVRFNAGSKV